MLLFVILFMTFLSSLCDATDLFDDFVSNSTLKLEGSPFLLKKPLIVKRGVTLLIESGVVLKFCKDCSLMVRGRVLMKGTSQQRILLTSEEDGGKNGHWGMVKLFGTDHVVEFVDFEYGGSSSGYEEYSGWLSKSFVMLSIVGQKEEEYQHPLERLLRIHGCSFGHSQTGGIYSKNIDLVVTDCSFSDLKRGISLSQVNLVVEDSSFSRLSKGIHTPYTKDANGPYYDIAIRNSHFTSTDYVFDISSVKDVEIRDSHFTKNNIPDKVSDLWNGGSFVHIHGEGHVLFEKSRFECNSGEMRIESPKEIILKDNFFEGNIGRIFLSGPKTETERNVFYKNQVRTERGYDANLLAIISCDNSSTFQNNILIDNFVLFKNDDPRTSILLIGCIQYYDEEIAPEYPLKFRNNVIHNPSVHEDVNNRIYEIAIGMKNRAVGLENNFWGTEDPSVVRKRVYTITEKGGEIEEIDVEVKVEPLLPKSAFPNFEEMVKRKCSECQVPIFENRERVFKCKNRWGSLVYADKEGVCSGNGKCVEDSLCVCEEGYEGEACDIKVVAVEVEDLGDKGEETKEETLEWKYHMYHAYEWSSESSKNGGGKKKT